MKIAGLITNSVIDFPEKIAAVVFTQGCNFRCGFCHNPDLLDISLAGKKTEEEFFDFLRKRVGLLDGVVITGGEPTLQTDLLQFMRKIRSMGFLIKLDTNGANPKILATTLEEKLVDYVAMDIKGPFDSYKRITGFDDIEKIKQSIQLIMTDGVDYEFRTTVLPTYHSVEDFEKVGEAISGAKNFTVQNFRPEITFDKKLEDQKPFSDNDLGEIAEIMKKYVKKVRVLKN